MEMLADLNKETVDLQPNYDESLTEPAVLPSRFPNLLVNGSSGIAVGMATNVPPHNLREVAAAVDMLSTTPCHHRRAHDRAPGPDFLRAASSWVPRAFATRTRPAAVASPCAPRSVEQTRTAASARWSPRFPMPSTRAFSGEKIAHSGQREESRYLGHARRVQPQGHAHCHRPQAGRYPAGGPQQPL